MTSAPQSIPESLGIIAGKGAYPLELAASARTQGVRRLFAVAFKGETRRQISSLVDDVRWQSVGQLGLFVDHFAASGVSQAVMAGQITPTNLFRLRVDRDMRELLRSLPQKNADTIFSAIGDRLRSVGVELIPAFRFMEKSIPEPAVLTERVATPQELADIELGIRVAKASGALKIGQTVVVKEGTILAVEAFEGTDQAIRRGGRLGGPGSVVVKVAQPDHDMRFDIPVVGLRTLKSLRKAGATALAVEAGSTILLEREAVLTEARKMGLYMVARDMELK